MKTPISKETAEARVTHKFDKLYKPLVELVDSLQQLEPGGTLVDDVVITKKEDEKKIRFEYVAMPISIKIKTDKRTMILRVIENEG